MGDVPFFKIVTLGCRTNQYESRVYYSQLSQLGWQEGENPQLCIVNTCTVTSSADSDSKREIQKLRALYPQAKLVVTGCYAESQGAALKNLLGIDHVIPNGDKEALLNIVFPEIQPPTFSLQGETKRTRAFVKVQDGCNSFCTYCVIPFVRGRSRSRSLSEVKLEVVGLLKQGYKEIVLTGINIGDFDGKGEGSLADLIRALDSLPRLKRLRISSIDPDEVSEDLLSAVLEGKNTCPSMHIVLQSGSNFILKRMNRKYTQQMFLDTAERVCAANPSFTITTDVLVGFPGESETDFQESVSVVKKVGFARVHMFPYSARPGTRAASYPNPVSKAVLQKRKKHLLAIAEQVALEKRESFVGKTMFVLLEKRVGDYWAGYSENFLWVFVDRGSFEGSINELVQVTIKKNSRAGLYGVVA